MDQKSIELFKSVVSNVVNDEIPDRNYFAEMINNMITDAATKRNVSRAEVVEEMKGFIAELEKQRKSYIDAHEIA